MVLHVRRSIDEKTAQSFSIHNGRKLKFDKFFYLRSQKKILRNTFFTYLFKGIFFLNLGMIIEGLFITKIRQ